MKQTHSSCLMNLWRGVAAAALMLIAGSSFAQVTQTFGPGAAMTIGPNAGAGVPYPSDILVSGMPTVITDVNVTLTGVSHTWPDDIDLVLRSPSGTYVVLISDCGGGTDAVNLTWTIDQAAGALMADNALNASGTYRPTNFGASDTYPAPVGAINQATPNLDNFNTSDPNGTWSLYSMDGFNLDGGSIASWSIEITSQAPAVPNCAGTFSPVNFATGVSLNPTLTWGAVAGATGYRISFGTNSPAFDNILSNFDLGNALSYYTGILPANADYGWTITPYSGAGDAIGCTPNVFQTGAANCTALNYCAAGSADCNGDEFLSNVTFGGINNTTSFGVGCYNDYRNLSTQVNIGVPQPLTFINGNPFTGDQAAAWVDWDQNGVFGNNANEVYPATDVNGNQVNWAATITPPVGAVLGFTTMRVRIMWTGAVDPCGNATYGEVEDYCVEVLPAPPCDPPTALTATATGSTTADFAWTPAGGATMWDIYYGPTPLAAPGPGTPPTVDDHNANTYSAAGLTANTPYAVYVRSDCGGAQSPWVGPVAFTTPCGTVAVPYTENFNSLTPGPAAGACVVVDRVGTSICWTNVSDGSNNFWHVYNLATPSANTGIDAGPPGGDFDHTPGAGGNYLYLESSACFGNTSDLLSPVFDVSTLGRGPELRFWYHMFGATMGTLSVFASNDGGATWSPSPVWTLSGNQGNVWNEAVVNLSAYTGETDLRLMFRGTTGASFTSDMVIDDVSIVELPTCPQVSGLTAVATSPTSANLGWTAGGGETQWQIEYGTFGFAFGTGTRVLTNSNPYNLGGLVANTRYSYYVRAVCAPGDSSTWVGPRTFVPYDNCAGAASITHGVSCNFQTYSLASATIDLVSCGTAFGGTTNANVWFSFVATSTEMTILVQPTVGSTLYPIIELYSGPCNNPSSICCAFEGAGAGLLTDMVYTGLVPGNTYYFTVSHAIGSVPNNLNFGVCVSTPTPSACVLPGGVINQVEPEPCTGDVNGACAFATPLNLNSFPYNLSGAGFARCNLRDLDYYTFTLGADANLQFSLNAQFPSLAVLYSMPAGCGTQVQIGANHTSAACVTNTFSEGLTAGTYLLLVTPNDFFASPCSSGAYQLTINSICLEPTVTGITGLINGADFSWNAVAGASNYTWEIVPAGNGQGNGVVATGSAAGTSTTASGLMPNTAYDLYIMTDCGGGNMSAWGGPYNFTTAPTCGQTFYDSGGAGGDYVDNESSTWVICSDIPANLVNLGFNSFDLEDGFDFFLVYDGPSVASPLVGVFTGATLPPAQASTHPSGCLTVQFLSDISVPAAGWDISVTCTPQPNCLTPGDVDVTNVGPNTADVSWTCAGCTGNYIVEYGPVGFIPGTDGNPGAGTIITGGSPQTITGLLPGTEYDVYVRQECTPGVEYSSNTPVFTFVTSIDCSLAIPLACETPVSFSLSGTGVYETIDCGFFTPGQEVLYSFVAPFTGNYVLNVTASNSEWADYFYKDASLGCGPEGWTCIDDNNGPGNDNFNLVGGVTYYILVSAEDDQVTTDHTFQIICPNPPANDECVNAVDITCGNTYAGTTVGANIDAIPNGACGAGGPSSGGVWYHFAGNGDAVTVTTCPATFDTRISVLSGSCGALTCMGGNDDDAACGTASTVSFQTVNGVDYYVLVHGWDVQFGTFDLAVSCVTPCTPTPVNDDCAGATPLTVWATGVGVNTNSTNACATETQGLPQPNCDLGVLKDVWFSFNSGSNTSVSVYTALAGASNLRMQLYFGNCGALIGAAGTCNNPASPTEVFTVTQNTQYYLRVWNQGGPGVEGGFTIRVEGICGSQPGVVYVNDNASGANNGTSWSNAFTSLQSALAAAVAGDEIWVAQGTYYPSAVNDMNAVFALKPDVSLYGGFPDNLLCNAAGRNPALYVTTLSGDLGVIGNNADNSNRVVSAINVGSNVVVDGFTISGGRNMNTNGGGIGITGNAGTSSPTFIACRITDNWSDYRGGGTFVYARNGGVANPSFTDCVFSNNSCSINGGGLSTLTETGGTISVNLDNVDFMNNSAVSMGGAVATYSNNATGQSLNATDCDFSGNVATQNGGAIWNYGKGGASILCSVDNSTFNGNTAKSGQGLFSFTNSGATVTSNLTMCSFTNNTGTKYGPVTNYAQGGSVSTTANNCTFTGNTTLEGGGISNVALSAGSATATANACLFSGNSARGGGVFASGLNVGTTVNTSVTNSVFCSNTSSAQGGAVSISATSSAANAFNLVQATVYGNTAVTGGAVQNAASSGGTSSLLVTNSIVRGNVATNSASRSFQTNGAAASTTLIYCDVDTADCAANNAGTGVFSCSNIIAADPMFVDAANCDLHLMAGSPAIDAAPSGDMFDYDGNSRPAGAGYDLGAFEYGAVAPRLAAAPVVNNVPAMDVVVYPNPNDGRFIMSFGSFAGMNNVMVQVFDIQGSRILAQEFNKAASAEFDLGDYASGTYFVQVISGNQVVTRKVMVTGRP